MFCRQIISRVNSITHSHSRSSHAYNGSPLTLSQLENHLFNHAKYEGGLVTLNKPVGVSLERGLVDADTLNPAKDVCIKSALPAVKKHFNVNELISVKIPERNVSGVTILSDNGNLAGEVKKWWRTVRERQECIETYHAVVMGQPVNDCGQFNGTISLLTNNNIKRVVLSEEIRKNAVKRGEAKRVVFNYRTLTTNGVASLVEVKTSRTKWSAVRVFLASHTLTPVLGDNLYGMYVKHVLGSAVPEDLFGKTQLCKVKLSQNLMEQLDLVGRKNLTVPLHLHLCSARLMENGHNTFEYCIPYPQVFNWTLDKLGLAGETVLAASAPT